MALTYTFIDSSVLGNWEAFVFNIKLDTSYPTGGYSITPSKVKLKTIIGVEFWGVNAAGSAIIIPYWDYTNVKLMAFQGGGVPTGTIGGNVTVVGGAIGEAIGINPDSNAGVLSKAAATNRTIPIATFLGAAPTFTGTAANGAQVANLANLSAVTIRCLFVGR